MSAFKVRIDHAPPHGEAGSPGGRPRATWKRLLVPASHAALTQKANVTRINVRSFPQSLVLPQEGQALPFGAKPRPRI
jgi:hypothetical protein